MSFKINCMVTSTEINSHQSISGQKKYLHEVSLYAMERTSVNLETLKDIPGYRVILKTVLQSQIQQLVEQLSKHTEEEAVFLTASLGDGTISHIGSGVGKQFLHENDEVKSKFLAFCLKRHHDIATNLQSKLTASQDQAPVSFKMTGSSIASSHRHSPYSTSVSRRRNSQRQPANKPLDQLNNDLDKIVPSESDRKVLESMSIELADDCDDNENADDNDLTDNEGLSDDLDESNQKSNMLVIKNVMCNFEPNTHENTMGDNNLDVFIPNSNIKDEPGYASESSAQIHAGGRLQFGIGVDTNSGVDLASQGAVAATGVYADEQDNDMIDMQEETVQDRSILREPAKKTIFHFSSELERKPSQYTSKDGRFNCDECDFSSRFTHNLRKHLWQIHQRKESKPLNTAPQFIKRKGFFHCEYCSFKTKFSPSLNRHINVLHKKFTYKCGICNKSYNNAFNLKEHIQCVHENKKIECEFCSRQFNARSTLYNHLKKEHGTSRSEQAKKR